MSRPAVLVVARFDDGHHAHAAQRCRAMERLGCRVEAFDLLQRPGFLERFSGGDLRARLKKAVETARAQMVMAIGGMDLEPEAIRELRDATGVPWCNWFPDDLRTLEEVKRLAPAFDRVFVASTDMADQVAPVLSRTPDIVSLAADPSVYRPIRSKDQYRANVVFAGAATARREALLSGLVEFGLALWGPGWRGTSLRDYCRGEVPSTEDYVRAYGGASVAINIHHTVSGNGVRECFVNQRLFEVASIGVPQVVDERGDLPAHFEPNRDLLVFRDANQLRGLVQAVLQDLPAAEEIGAQGRRTALGRHTYMHRMKAILEAL